MIIIVIVIIIIIIVIVIIIVSVITTIIINRVVELPKTEEGLGFNVMGGKEQNSPIYISRIIPG